MKRATLMVPILAIALTLPLFAQAERDVKTGGTGKEETLKLSINGGANIAFAYDSDQLRETITWTNGGLATGNVLSDPYYYFNGPAWIQFLASLQDNVELNITIRNVPFSDGNGVQLEGGADAIVGRANWGDDITNGVTFKYVYMRIKELFNAHWSLSMGQQPVVWDVRGKGNALFLDVSHAESPWGDISRAWATSVRMEQFPVGFKVGYNHDALAMELGLFPVVHEAGMLGGGLAPAAANGSMQQGLYYLNAIYNIDDQGNRIGAIIALFHGVNPGDNVITFGVSGVFSPSKDFELFAEAYAQWGRAWSKGRGALGGGVAGGPPGGAAPFVENGDHSAYMFLLGGRIDIPGETAAYIEMHILYASGHDMDDGTQFSQANGMALGGANNEDSNEFMSYENYDVMVLLNSNEWGYDLDNNITQITIQGGVMLNAGGTMKNNLHLILKLAYAVANEDWEVAAVPGVHAQEDEDALGFEVDATIRWFANKNASLYFTVAYLAGSEVLELFSRDKDGFAWVALLGFEVNH